jgi:hypothetical protein
LRNRTLLLVVVSLLLFVDCGSGAKSDDLVLDAVRHHLSNRTDLTLANMDLKLDRVDYQQDTAEAQVTIVARADEQARMQMVYRLRRSGDGWEVVPGASGAGGGHGGGMTTPPAQPPGEGQGGELPQGHPPVGGEGSGSSSDLPAGHPPVQKR